MDEPHRAGRSTHAARSAGFADPLTFTSAQPRPEVSMTTTGPFRVGRGSDARRDPWKSAVAVPRRSTRTAWRVRSGSRGRHPDVHRRPNRALPPFCRTKKADEILSRVIGLQTLATEASEVDDCNFLTPATGPPAVTANTCVLALVPFGLTARSSMSSALTTEDCAWPPWEARADARLKLVAAIASIEPCPRNDASNPSADGEDQGCMYE